MKISFVLVFTFFSICVYAQNLRGNFNYKATYKLTFSLDSTETGKPMTEVMILFLGNNTSVFSSRAKTIANEPIVLGNSRHTSKTAVTKFQYVLIKDYKRDLLYYTRQIINDFFYYEQPKDICTWQLSVEKKTINDYTAQKATTTCSGREYVAWFTTEIPIMDGPYKFSGSPGLIIELYDRQNHYHFELIGLEKLDPHPSLKTNLKHYIHTDKETFQNTELRYRRDPFSYSKNPNITITPEVHKKYIESFAEMLEKENNPIERE